MALAATALRWIPEVLGEFSTRHPHVRFRLIQAETAAMHDQLEHGSTDLCLSSQPLEGPDLSWALLLTEEILLAVAATHPLAGRRSIRRAEIAREPFVGLKPGYDMRDLTDRFCRQAGFAPELVCEVDKPAAIWALVRAGLGVAFLPAASWRVTDETEPIAIDIAAPASRYTWDSYGARVATSPSPPNGSATSSLNTSLEMLTGRSAALPRARALATAAACTDLLEPGQTNVCGKPNFANRVTLRTNAVSTAICSSSIVTTWIVCARYSAPSAAR